MSIYHKLLVAIELSIEAEQVLRKASGIAQQNNASLDVIHVVEPVVIETGFDAVSSIDFQIEESLVDRSKQNILELLTKLDIKVGEILLPVGSVKHEIHQAAKQRESDLIVIGTHGRHGMGLLLGSTANSVLHGAEWDVLSVKLESEN